VIRTNQSQLIQLITKFQTLELTKTSLTPKSTLLMKKRNKTTSGFQSKIQMDHGTFHLLLFKPDPIQFATQLVAQRASGLERKKSQAKM
jgi:hypothetical protein